MQHSQRERQQERRDKAPASNRRKRHAAWLSIYYCGLPNKVTGSMDGLIKAMKAAINLNARSVGEIMTVRVSTVDMDDSLDVIKDIFRKVPFHHLLVVEHKKLVGVISDRDFLKAISPYVGTMSETNRDRDTLNKRAHQIMSHHPVTVRRSCSLQEAAKLMLIRGVSCLPVTTVEKVILGVITWRDLFKAFLDSTAPCTPDSSQLK